MLKCVSLVAALQSVAPRRSMEKEHGYFTVEIQCSPASRGVGGAALSVVNVRDPCICHGVRITRQGRKGSHTLDALVTGLDCPVGAPLTEIYMMYI